MALHGVILNMATRMRSSIKNVFSEQWLGSSCSTRTYIFKEDIFTIILGSSWPPPPRAGNPDRQMQSRANKGKNYHVQSCWSLNCNNLYIFDRESDWTEDACSYDHHLTLTWKKLIVENQSNRLIIYITLKLAALSTRLLKRKCKSLTYIR
jgi:hypothetical protein